MTKSKIEKKIKEGNLYDKIFKENAESIFIPLIEKRLGIKIVSYKSFKEKLQTTLEREMDFFYEILTDKGEKFILHLEFQTENDPDMIYREAEYHGIALRKNKTEIKHIVVYLGDNTPTMQTQLEEKYIFKGFDLIVIHNFDTNELLSSQVPEEIILAILSNYPREQAESILRLIIRKLKTVCKNPTRLSKFLKQLIVLARLRKIEDLTIKISEEMPITYDIETDYLYQRGMETGEVRGEIRGEIRGTEKERYSSKVNFVKNLLLNFDFDDAQICSMVEVDLDFIREVRAKLFDNPKQ